MTTEQRMAELAAEHAAASRRLAAVAEASVAVHEQAAKVHERLKDPLLTPEQLRDHAERDRRLAALERARAEELEGRS
jgi:hypothetical protein